MINNEILGKVPPQAVDIEEFIIGSIMIDKKGLDEVISIIFPEIFYKKEHQYIYTAIRNLYNNSNPIDLYTVSNELRKEGKLDLIGGELYLIELTQKVISSAHIEYHGKIVLQKFLLRELIKISSDLIKKCYEHNTDIFDLLNYAENKIFEINQKYLMKKKYESTEDLVNRVIEKIRTTKNKGLSGVPSGFHKLDSITSGWQNSDLIVIASRPGMGKTTFMLSMVANISLKKNIPIAIFSLEMSPVQLITKLISSETKISSEKIRKANLSRSDWECLIEKSEKIKRSPLYINDTPSLSIFDLRAKCRNLISKKKVKLILIDYMQLMRNHHTYRSQNREQEISIISRNLKSIAKELDIPIIVLSQLSRAVENRGGNKRPLLSDLRESGAIEQDADIVIFIYRPEYYGFKIWDSDYHNESCNGQAEVIISKHRNGSLNKFRLQFIADQSRFENFKETNPVPLDWEEDYKKNVIDYENNRLNNKINKNGDNNTLFSSIFLDEENE
ncbi:replicative DNA helicase [Blattabacterium cuenoti]|uniref:replicative DNA helicase n=1 Tax=Blattabacterium cuenoti TaxID=1653831 RepID=UPI00163C2350|nr:replicative DNA helicase [Blattabacterium cuenoti]